MTSTMVVAESTRQSTNWHFLSLCRSRAGGALVFPDEHLRGCWRSSGATATSLVLICTDGKTRFTVGGASSRYDERHGSSVSHVTWIELDEVYEVASEPCDDVASTEKTDDVEEEAEEEIDDE